MLVDCIGRKSPLSCRDWRATYVGNIHGRLRDRSILEILWGSKPLCRGRWQELPPELRIIVTTVERGDWKVGRRERRHQLSSTNRASNSLAAHVDWSTVPSRSRLTVDPSAPSIPDSRLPTKLRLPICLLALCGGC